MREAQTYESEGRSRREHRVEKGKSMFGRSFVKELIYFFNTEVGAFN